MKNTNIFYTTVGIIIIALLILFNTTTGKNVKNNISKQAVESLTKAGLISKRDILLEKINTSLGEIKEKMVNINYRIKYTEVQQQTYSNKIANLKKDLNMPKEELIKAVKTDPKLRYKVLLYKNFLAFNKALDTNMSKLLKVKEQLQKIYTSLLMKKQLLDTQFSLKETLAVINDIKDSTTNTNIGSIANELNGLEKEIMEEDLRLKAITETNDFTNSMNSAFTEPSIDDTETDLVEFINANL